MGKIVCAIICGILAAVALTVSVMSFIGKGFLFNNAYIWASKRERDELDKKPYYKQSAVVFAFIAAIFVCLAIEAVLETGWLFIVEGALVVAVLVYAIASSKK